MYYALYMKSKICNLGTVYHNGQDYDDGLMSSFALDFWWLLTNLRCVQLSKTPNTPPTRFTTHQDNCHKILHAYLLC